MSYLPLIIFLLLAIAAVGAEVMWLTRQGWCTRGKAVSFVLATDLIGLGFGGFVSFALLGIMLMMTFGPSGTGGNSSDGVYWLLTVAGVLAPPMILTLLKRVLMLAYRMPGGRRAWAFSTVAGFAAAAVVLLLPSLAYYLLVTYV